MDNLSVKPTKITPTVDFNANTGFLNITGKSLPENSFEFFMPLLDWLDIFLAQDLLPSIKVNFKLEYFNTSSTSHFLKLIRKFDKLYQNGQDVEVTWFHDLEDEDMKEAGEDFQLLIKMPIIISGIDFSKEVL